MCGINGILTLNKRFDLSDAITKMNQRIIHRGPDDYGEYLETEKSFSLALGMRRLSIIDLSSGGQPIFSKDGKKVIVFNGEIYNFLELKSEKLSEYSFQTNSDTEVILALYEKYGVESFSLLDGMFVFTIYDRNLNKIFIARDFFGEKPLYYSLFDKTFLWGSELKSLLQVMPEKPGISKKGLNIFFKLHYIPAPFTIFDSVKKLEANNFIELDCLSLTYNLVEIKQRSIIDKTNLNFNDAKHLNFELIDKSVKSRSISDVPIGTFLSGGVDSSIVSFCLANNSMERINTFSVGFEKRTFNETHKSRLVANLINSHHHEITFTENDLVQIVDKVLLNFDEPFADSSSLPTFLVSQYTENYVKVALTGDGGDEIYGGYNKYYMGKLNKIYTHFIPKKIHFSTKDIIKKIFKSQEDKRGFAYKLDRFLESVNYNDEFYFNIISLAFQDNERKQILNSNSFICEVLDYYKDVIGINKNSLTDFRNIDRIISLEGDLLPKVDRTSMLSSLECRAPFLNKELWQFTKNLPEKYLINNWDKKYILKESFKEYFPNRFFESPKQGFGAPVGDWLRGILKEELLSFLDEKFIIEQDIFNFKNIKEIVLNHIFGVDDNSVKVFTFYCFQKWYLHTYKSSKTC